MADDRCPHSRLITVAFRGCERFDPVTFEATDFHDNPLGVHVTCRHLGAASANGMVDSVEGPWYPRCALGGPPDFALSPRPAG